MSFDGYEVEQPKRFDGEALVLLLAFLTTFGLGVTVGMVIVEGNLL